MKHSRLRLHVVKEGQHVHVDTRIVVSEHTPIVTGRWVQTPVKERIHQSEILCCGFLGAFLELYATTKTLYLPPILIGSASRHEPLGKFLLG